MTIHDTFAGAQFATSIADLADNMGMKLQVGDDFQHYADMIRELRTDQPLGDPFNLEKQELTHENAFWISGWDKAGDLVHTQAIRRLQIKNSLADFMQKSFRQFPPSGCDLDMGRSTYTPGPGARGIRGVVCYHGEAWLRSGKGGFRGTGIAGALARFAMTTAVLRWSPDYIFCFVPEGLAYRGLVEREGYMHTDPGALAWQLRDGPQLRGFMGWMGREDLTHMMGIPTETLLVA